MELVALFINIAAALILLGITLLWSAHKDKQWELKQKRESERLHKAAVAMGPVTVDRSYTKSLIDTHTKYITECERVYDEIMAIDI